MLIANRKSLFAIFVDRIINLLYNNCWWIHCKEVLPYLSILFTSIDKGKTSNGYATRVQLFNNSRPCRGGFCAFMGYNIAVDKNEF